MKTLILCIFYVSPIIDGITGYFMGISGTENAISKIYRIIAFSILYFAYFKIAGRNKATYQILLTGYAGLLLLYYALCGGNLIVDGSYIVKLFYPIILVSVSRVLYKEQKFDFGDINKVIGYYSLIYPSIIIVSTIMGIGHSAYGGRDEGYMGVFSGGNEISIVLAILFMVNMQRLYLKINKKGIAIAILLGFSLLMTQTKTSYIIAAMTLVLFVAKKIREYPEKLYKNVMLILLVSMCITVYILLQEKQIILMINRLTFRYYQLGSSFFNMLFSNRQNKILPVMKANYRFGMGGVCNFLFGRGFYAQVLRDDNATFGLVEMDLFDVLFQNGIVMLCIVARFYWHIVKQSVRSRDTLVSFAYTMAFLFSILAGHVLYNPLSSTVFALLCIYVYAHRTPFFNKVRKYSDKGSMKL